MKLMQSILFSGLALRNYQRLFLEDTLQTIELWKNMLQILKDYI